MSKKVKIPKQLTKCCNSVLLKWKWRDRLCVQRNRKDDNCVFSVSVAKTQTCIATLFPWVYVVPPLIYIIKNDKRLVGSIYDISMLRRSQTQSDTYQRGVCTQTPAEENMQHIQWISLMLIKSHKTLTNICTGFVNSTVANLFPCHWWQETDDIITFPPNSQYPTSIWLWMLH